MNAKTPELKLNRFCGEEIFPVKSAKWSFFYDEYVDSNNFSLEIEAKEGTVLGKDTKKHKIKPSWEINCYSNDLNRKDIVPGLKVELLEGFDKETDTDITNFYYFEHQTTNDNKIEILESDGNKLLIRLTGKTTDVDFDGSKPETELSAEIWFDYWHIE